MIDDDCWLVGGLDRSNIEVMQTTLFLWMVLICWGMADHLIADYRSHSTASVSKIFFFVKLSIDHNYLNSEPSFSKQDSLNTAQYGNTSEIEKPCHSSVLSDKHVNLETAPQVMTFHRGPVASSPYFNLQELAQGLEKKQSLWSITVTTSNFI